MELLRSMQYTHRPLTMLLLCTPLHPSTPPMHSLFLRPPLLPPSRSANAKSSEPSAWTPSNSIAPSLRLLQGAPLPNAKPPPLNNSTMLCSRPQPPPQKTTQTTPTNAPLPTTPQPLKPPFLPQIPTHLTQPPIHPPSTILLPPSLPKLAHGRSFLG